MTIYTEFPPTLHLKFVVDNYFLASDFGRLLPAYPEPASKSHILQLGVSTKLGA